MENRLFFRKDLVLSLKCGHTCAQDLRTDKYTHGADTVQETRPLNTTIMHKNKRNKKADSGSKFNDTDEVEVKTHTAACA